MNPQIVCRCGEIVMKSESGTDKIRSKIVLIRDGEVIAVCKGCNGEILLPLTRSATPLAGPPLILRK